jgi:HK97 family phage major capsid protein
MDSQLVTFNTLGQPLIYRPEQAGQPASLDGYPIHWVEVLPAYSTAANASASPILFGDMSYGYLGMRRDVDVQTSRDVFFATDEIGIRALERFDVNLMANAALAAIRTAAA